MHERMRQKTHTCKHKHKHKQTPPGAPRGPFDWPTFAQTIFLQRETWKQYLKQLLKRSLKRNLKRNQTQNDNESFSIYFITETFRYRFVFGFVSGLCVMCSLQVFVTGFGRPTGPGEAPRRPRRPGRPTYLQLPPPKPACPWLVKQIKGTLHRTAWDIRRPRKPAFCYFFEMFLYETSKVSFRFRLPQS